MRKMKDFGLQITHKTEMKSKSSFSYFLYLL